MGCSGSKELSPLEKEVNDIWAYHCSQPYSRPMTTEMMEQYFRRDGGGPGGGHGTAPLHPRTIAHLQEEERQEDERMHGGILRHLQHEEGLHPDTIAYLQGIGFGRGAGRGIVQGSHHHPASHHPASHHPASHLGGGFGIPSHHGPHSTASSRGPPPQPNVFSMTASHQSSRHPSRRTRGSRNTGQSSGPPSHQSWHHASSHASGSRSSGTRSSSSAVPIRGRGRGRGGIPQRSRVARGPATIANDSEESD